MTFGSAEIILDMNSLHQKNGDSCILIYFSIDQRYSIQQTERFYWIGEKYVLFWPIFIFIKDTFKEILCILTMLKKCKFDFELVLP